MSSRYTTHPVSDEKWYEEKCKDFQDGKCDSYGHIIDKSSNKGTSTGYSSDKLNPLENPECFGITLFCHKCKRDFRMSLIKHNELHSNSGYFKIKNRAEEKLCPKCYKNYVLNELHLKINGLATDVEVGKIAEEITKHPYGWEYQLGFIDGYILCRDGKRNILSELSD